MKKKILIIEDNIEIAELLRDSLMAVGFEARVCHDAYQGVEFTKKIKPDLLVLDIMIPAGSGFSVLKNIKLSSYTKFIPVVILTASRDSDHKKKALAMGADAYFEKPYDSKELIDKIKELLGVE